MKRKHINEFYAVYDNGGKVMSISYDKDEAKREALRVSRYRWTYQTFERDWGYLLKDGWKLLKSKIEPIEKKYENT